MAFCHDNRQVTTAGVMDANLTFKIRITFDLSEYMYK